METLYLYSSNDNLPVTVGEVIGPGILSQGFFYQNPSLNFFCFECQGVLIRFLLIRLRALRNFSRGLALKSEGGYNEDSFLYSSNDNLVVIVGEVIGPGILSQGFFWDEIFKVLFFMYNELTEAFG